VAHPEHDRGVNYSYQEAFDGEGVLGDKQHGLNTGHLPAKQENVAVIGTAELSAPEGTDGDMTGRVADVSAHGDYAYLTSFRSNDCLGGGAWVVDISDPTAPAEVNFLPTTNGNYAGEGSQVITPAYGPFGSSSSCTRTRPAVRRWPRRRASRGSLAASTSGTSPTR
jgi:hypothetical protein